MNISNFESKEWLSSRKWGICVHFPLQVSGMIFNQYADIKDINDNVTSFDVKNFAKTIHELNAGYVLFNIMFKHRYMLAPNKTYDQITGFRPGEGCATRDVVAELIDALNEYDIPLFISIAANGPCGNTYAGKKFGYYNPLEQYISENFIEKWSAVIREYAIRYGENVKGWFFNHAFDRLGFDGHDDDFLKSLHDATKSGNENALIAFNNGHIQVDYNNPKYATLLTGVLHPNKKVNILLELSKAGNELAISAFKRQPGNATRYSKYEDFTAGETIHLDETPISKYVEGSLWHKFSYIGMPTTNITPWGAEGWGCPGSVYSSDYLYNYVKTCNEKGGIVTLDVCTFTDGHIDWGQYEILKRLSDLR